MNMKQKFTVQGMSCSACSARIEKWVNALPGMERVDVNLLSGSMVCEYDEDAVSEKEILKAVKDAGYAAYAGSGEVTDEKRNLKKRLIISVIFLIPIMHIAMGGPIPHDDAFMRSLLPGLLLIPIVAANRTYYQKGLGLLFKGSSNMDTLIAIGTAASMALLYFEAAGMILTLVTLGKFLEALSKGRTTDAIEGLMKLMPETANVIREFEGQKVEITIKSENLKEGDVCAVRPGETVPADGVIIKGSTFMDESAVTGESIPKEKKAGDEVISATVNSSGYFEMRVTAAGEDAAISKIIHLVEDAASSKAPIGRLADRIAGIFVPCVIGIAIVSFALWMIAGKDLSFSLTRAIAVLVVSCPCALGLATPVAVMTGTGRGAGEGILIKSAETLEMLHKVDTVVFDKTGTLTKGTPAVSDIYGTDDTLWLIASLEQKSEHPLGRAAVKKAEGLELPAFDSFEYVPGRGIRSGSLVAGSRRFMEELGLVMADDIRSEADRFASEGKSMIFAGRGEVVTGVMAFSDEPREGAGETVRRLKELGTEVILLTGDGKEAAEHAAALAGIERVISEVLPQDKDQVIRELKEEGKTVLMAGDGINDAPAIAGADIGAAIAAGTDIAMDSADIVLTGEDISGVGKAIVLGRKAYRNIKENLFWALIYNVLLIPLAAGLWYPFTGWLLNPMISALCMSISSVCVVTNALRLINVKLQ